jgi:deoxyuridine 5'-triphosphate nucleotidohydrolase
MKGFNMVEFLLTNEYPVKEPKFQFPDNAGIDGFIPSNTVEFRTKLKEKNPELEFYSGAFMKPNVKASYYDITTGTIYLAPHSSTLIPSGLYMKIPSDSALIDFNKSGIATKKKLVVGACIIDYSYQGIIHYHVINTSDEYQVIKCDEKIMQMVEVKIGNGAKVYSGLTPEEFFTEKSSRGDGGFGSTGLN